MKPRSLTPLWWMPRSSRRTTAWLNVAWETEKAMWWTAPVAVEVGLLEHEGHAQDALPEVDRGLAVGAHEGDVVDALGLELLHVVGLPSSSCSTSFDLYSLRCRVPHGTRSMRVCTTSAAR